jgi:hypothetical protein
MGVRRITWRFWAALVIGLAVYGLLGWWWSGNGTIEEWIYRIGLTAAAILPLVFTGIYSFRAKWWTNEIGTALVLAVLALVPLSAPLAYVFWFNNGLLNASWLAWLAISGPCLSALALMGMSRVWLRVGREQL